MRWIKLTVLLFALGVAGAAAYLLQPWSKAEARINPAISCDFNGKTYHGGKTRSADDGCNVCRCGPHGWSCSKFACPAEARDSSAVISGRLADDAARASSLRVCAMNLGLLNERCVQTADGARTYEIRVPLGRYFVYAVSSSGRPNGRAYYTEAAKCGLKPGCKDHSPIALRADAAGQTLSADPVDWYKGGSIERFDVSPSRTLDNIFYFDGSVFNVLGKNLAGVEIFYRPFPSEASDPLRSLGKAALKSTDNDLQTWELPVPPGLDAQVVLARATDASGRLIRWPGQGRLLSMKMLDAGPQPQ